MFDLRGTAATRLFIKRIKDKNCNNVALRKSLCEKTTRDGMQDEEDEKTIDRLPKLLPAASKLREFVEKNLNQLFCQCRLCGNEDGEERRFRRWISSSGVPEDGTVKGICILILSGCLFALNVFYKLGRLELLSKLSSQTERGDCSPVPPRLLDRFRTTPSGEPEQCPHIFSPESTDFTDCESIQARQLCDTCLTNAFEHAILLWSKILNIPTLQKTIGVDDRINQNLPFISQLEIVPDRGRTKSYLSFYSSKIEPGYCRLPGLKDRELFRKVYQYRPHQELQIKRAVREAELGLKLSEKNHKNIAHTLFALLRDDGDYKYIELVFPRYKEDLDSILLQSSPDARGSSESTEDPLNSPLWNAMMGVFEAVAVMHNDIESSQLKCRGHFDIKPSNILREKPENDFGSLLLADFGQAAETRAGAIDYAPPELSLDRGNPERYLRPSYDIWSMACVLVKVLVFLAGGESELKNFDRRCRHNRDDGAFWQGENYSNTTLRPEVLKSMELIEGKYSKEESGLRVKNVIDTLRAMLSIYPNKRPSTTSCLARLKCNHGQELIECGLEEWKTSYSYHRNMQIPATLYIYRDQYSRVRRGDMEENLTLDIQVVSCETKHIQSVSMVPLSFFDPENSLCGVFACRFENLHKGVTFNFTHLDDFLKFIEIITYQRIIPVLPNDPFSGIDIHFSSCSTKESASLFGFGRRVTDYGPGRIQVWNELLPDEYNKLYRKSFMASSVRTGRQVRHPQNVWKLALWTTTKKPVERVCIIVDIGAVWEGEKPPKSDRHFWLKQRPGSSFRGGVLKPSKQEKETHASQETFPGFPILPHLLLTKLGMELRSLEIEFASADDREKFLRILRRNGFQGKGLKERE